MDKMQPLLGLARRAGKLALGMSAVEKAVARNKAHLLIFATDCSGKMRDHLLADATACRHVQVGAKSEWGAFFGREQLAVFAILDDNFAKGLLGIFAEEGIVVHKTGNSR